MPHSLTFPDRLHLSSLAGLLIVSLLLELLIAPAEPTRAAGVLYVVPGGAGAHSGADWANAKDLQDALINSSSGEQVWVKTGTYKPTDGTDRSAPFQLKTGVAIYGGFAGTETTLDQRDPASNITILNGDLFGNDTGVVAGTNPSRLDNSYHVVTASGTDGTALLDGFTITGGNANYGGNIDGFGGGMLIQTSSLTIHRIVFLHNTAGDGGGMYSADSSPSISDSVFEDNEAGAGGGIYISGGAPTLRDSVFDKNTASNGGGMYANGGNPIIANVSFRENTAYHYGGGISANNSHPTLSHAVFDKNSAEYGGGMYNNHSDSLLSHVVFAGNRSSWVGGGLVNVASNPVISHTTFSGNSALADDGGGAISNNASNPVISQSTFSANTIGGNRLAIGGALSNISSKPTLLNSILWGNGRPILDVSGSAVDVKSSLVQGGYLGGANVIDGNPQFEDADGADNIAGTLDDDLRLRPTSMAINRADNALIPADLVDDDHDGNTSEPAPFDLDGHPRVVNSVVDPGAYESSYALVPCPTSSRLYVDAATTGAATGTTWANAYLDLQTALNWTTACPNIAEIWVAHGKYKPSPRLDASATFQLKSGVAVYGGFAGTESTLSQRNLVGNATILSGDLLENDSGAIGIHNPARSDNSCQVVTGSGTDATAILDGFTVTGGNAYSNSDYRGGGMFNLYGSPAISNIVFSNNAAFDGGGMYSANGNLTIDNVIFDGNSAEDDAGGLFNENGDPIISHTTFRNNTAFDGGGLQNERGSPKLYGVVFTDNSAVVFGGGMYTSGGDLTIVDATFRGNVASHGNGGGLYSINGGLTVDHADFTDNIALNGGGLHTQNNSPTIRYISFIGNTATGRGGGLANVGSSPSISHAVFSGNSAETGGGMHSYGAPPGGGSQILRQVTLSNNSASFQGGGIYTYGGSLTLQNSVVWGNSGEQLFNNTNAITVDHSLVQSAGIYTGTGNLNADPIFVDADGTDNLTGTLDDDLRLQFGSPAIDAGHNAFIPADITDEDGDGNVGEPTPFDLDSKPRVVNGTVDMGAYEQQPTVDGSPPSHVTYGSTYSYTFSIGDSPATFSITAGELPPGLTLLSSGQLSGILAAAGTYTATIGISTSLGMDSHSFTFWVSKAPLTIKASDATRFVGALNPPFIATYNGFVNGDSSASLDGTLTFTSAATRASPPGTYPIRPGGLSSNNYELGYVDGILSVRLYGIYLPLVRY